MLAILSPLHRLSFIDLIAPFFFPFRNEIIKRIVLITITLLAYSFSFSQPNQHPDFTSDNVDGTFTNPLIHVDFPDPDIIRVGKDYYMVSSTFTTFPGVPIAHSTDLINWRIIGHTYDTLSSSMPYNLSNGKSMYRWGSWAPCIRYHKGKFYVFFNVEYDGFYIATASKPEGPYQLKKLGIPLYDPSVLFDDDDRVYVAHGSGTIMIAELDKNLDKVIGAPTPIAVGAFGTNYEGSHIYKRNGWYYICNTARGYNGMQICMRSKHIYGPYDSRVICADDMNYSDAGLHQGGFVDTKEGETWFFLFQDRDYVGRVPVLQPVSWVDDWPFIGSAEHRALVTIQKPSIPSAKQPNAHSTNNFVGSDDFDKPILNLTWHWNHVPDNSKWSLINKQGFLGLTGSYSPDFKNARNSLMQRIAGGGSEAITRIDITDLKLNDIAGLSIANLPYAGVGVKQNFGSQSILMFENNEVIEKIDVQNNKEIFFKVEATKEGVAKFSYSLEGKKYISIGKDFIMEFTVKTFLGNRIALFNFNTTEGNNGGTAYFDYFHLTLQQPIGNHYDAFKPISVCNYDQEKGAFEYRYLLKRPMQFLDQIRNGNWIGFNQLNFNRPASSFEVKALPIAGGTIELHEDSLHGKLLGTCSIEPLVILGKEYGMFSCPVSISTGIHRIFLLFKGELGSLYKLDSFVFKP